MSFSPVPRYSFRAVTDVEPGFLSGLGVRFLMLDLDNTLATYEEDEPSGSISSWVREIEASGVMLLILSNSRREGRVKAFSESLGINFKKAARKPSPKSVRAAMDEAGYGAEKSALIGDQAFTDALAANRAGVISIAVRPRSLRNPLLAARYALEAPFRAFSRRQKGNDHEQNR